MSTRSDSTPKRRICDEPNRTYDVVVRPIAGSMNGQVCTAA